MGLIMRYWKYYLSIVVEIVGIVLICTGLVEFTVSGTFNPADFFIVSGSLSIAVGSFIWAKIVKWDEFINRRAHPPQK